MSISEKELYEALQEIDHIQSACTRCGLCNACCKSYQAVFREEMGPRGKVELARAYMDGEIDPSSEVLDLFDSCLDCTCAKACPKNLDLKRLWKLVRELRDGLRPKAKKRWFSIFS